MGSDLLRSTILKKKLYEVIQNQFQKSGNTSHNLLQLPIYNFPDFHESSW